MQTHAEPLDADPTPVWRIAQAIVLLAAAALLIELFRHPDAAGVLFWKGVVPLLPATFMLSPSLWRNVCPLATCNELAAAVGAGRRLPLGWASLASLAGVAWLVTAISLRRVLFDDSGVATAALLLVAGALAVVLGLRYARKSGFCNSLCPVLPVERFYGQRPLLRIGNARCASCEACTLVGCVDLTPRRSLSAGIGRAPGPTAWLASPVGALVGAFPGIIVAYFSLEPSPAWGTLAWRFAACICVSLVVTALVALRVRNRSLVTRILAAISALLYYAFAAPTWAEAVGLVAAARSVQLLAIAFVLAWSWNALRPARA